VVRGSGMRTGAAAVLVAMALHRSKPGVDRKIPIGPRYARAERFNQKR